MSLILSLKPSTCNAASAANNNATSTAATTSLKAEAEASSIKTSMFPAVGPYSGTVFQSGQFNITISTVNKSPGTGADGSNQRNDATNESNEFLNRQMITTADYFNEKLYH